LSGEKEKKRMPNTVRGVAGAKRIERKIKNFFVSLLAPEVVANRGLKHQPEELNRKFDGELLHMANFFLSASSASIA
jgi:hypothetical protein